MLNDPITHFYLRVCRDLARAAKDGDKEAAEKYAAVADALESAYPAEISQAVNVALTPAFG